MTGQTPDDDDRDRAHERPGGPKDCGDLARRDSESVLDPAEDIPLVLLLARFAVVGFLGDSNYGSRDWHSLRA